MKRHEALHPLSHHHHHTLVLAQQMKNADDSSSIQQMTRDVIKFWQEDGENHFRDEEEVLLPLYAQYGSVEKDEIREMLIQHVQIRSYVHQIRSMSRKDRKIFNELGDLLQKHVRLEERVIFPMIEEAVPENYLYQANGRFHRDSYSGF
ncbi:Hemerythrin HHE cation binding domain-containing protein [Gracilibacillus ureilyticus]|uniref:Hemerythrin HHE cation binding domain-containing protein n=1 Tax=Gracilibacillus ureilyticus TaxID=531814 RepID=A0A1H9QR05_9BACI|nr:hemerythrin domain-containing protein [Gracilibacillus ureilyticus]SER62665.1 Hemerythrin HHE cation binding domain-containing protein [Gracilibacillus ureilyticus]